AWLRAPSPTQVALLSEAAALVGTRRQDEELAACLRLVTRPGDPPAALGRLALLAGLADGLARSGPSLRELRARPPQLLQQSLQGLDSIVRSAHDLAASDTAPTAARLLALQTLAHLPPQEVGPLTVRLLDAAQPAAVRSAAARALGAVGDPALA